MKSVLQKIYLSAKASNIELYSDHLQFAMNRYNITTPNRIRCFLAQLGHESGQLSAVTENLNYSASALRAVFHKYFPTLALAEQYARKPEKIANRVYANRMDNGSEESGDGWKYRGRGLIQLTGKYNYTQATQKMYALPIGVNFVLEPDLLATPTYATQSAAWFWENAGLNNLADKINGGNDEEIMRQITKKINGGYNGWDDRWNLYKRAKNIEF